MPMGNPFRRKPREGPSPTRERDVADLLKVELDEAISKLQSFTRELREAESMAEDFLEKHNSKTQEDGEEDA